MIIQKFTVISGLGWILDFFTFNVLVLLTDNPFASNLVSAFLGVSFVFWVARKLVFLDHQHPIRRSFLEYMVWNAIAIVLASMGVHALAHALPHVGVFAAAQQIWNQTFPTLSGLLASEPMAKILITPITMYANFVVTGFLIQRRVTWS